jgi:hypothetical protein
MALRFLRHHRFFHVVSQFVHAFEESEVDDFDVTRRRSLYKY